MNELTRKLVIINREAFGQKSVQLYELIIKRVLIMPDIYLDFPCEELLCKHITLKTLTHEKEYQYFISSRNVNLTCIWGSHIGKTNVLYHKNIIKKMKEDHFSNCVRIVKHVTNTGEYLWCDNLHSLIRYMSEVKKIKSKVYLSDISFYVVEINDIFDYIQILGEENSLSTDVVDLYGAALSGIKRTSRTSKEIYSHPYKIHDFLYSNPDLIN